MRTEAVPRFTVSQEQTRLLVPLVLVRDLRSDTTALEAKALKVLKVLRAQQAQMTRNQQKQMEREHILQLLLGSRHIPYA